MTRGTKHGEEKQRKLPDWEKLYHLYVEEGLSYREIAEMYGCARATVVQTLKERTLRRGLPWPIPGVERLHDGKQSRGHWTYREDKVDATKLRNWLDVRLGFSGESVAQFGGRHRLSLDLLYQLRRGSLTELRPAWAARVEAALRSDAATGGWTTKDVGVSPIDRT